jgi:hypothetical protein
VNAKQLSAKFADVGTSIGPLTFFDEHVALAFIRCAQESGLAISRVEMAGSDELHHVDRMPARILPDSERRTSWAHARSFVEMLAGRGLYFVVSLESPWSTRMARLRSMIRMVVRDNTSSLDLPP